MKIPKKNSKAFGLKSTFAYNDDVYMTSFGKGNDFVMEKLIFPDDKIKNLNDNPKFDISVLNQIITLEYKKNQIIINNPNKRIIMEKRSMIIYIFKLFII